MRLFARIEFLADDAPDDEPMEVERIVDDSVDVALWLRAQVQKYADEHGTAWEADLHIEPITRQSDE